MTAIEKAGSARLAPGIYFGLDEATYHGDPAIGSGSARRLAKCAMHYWAESWMNPLRPADTDTPAKLTGRALHKLILEGTEAFAKSFMVEPSRDEHPDALVTADDIKRVLRENGQKVSGTKPELTERLRLAVPDVVLWDDIVAAFEARLKETGATALKRFDYECVVAGAGVVAGDARIAPYFQNGRPEISVFWESDGVPLKARLDYTRLGKERDKTVGIIGDLKSYANKYEKASEYAVRDVIADLRLDVQAAQYLEGAALIPQFIAEGKVFGAEAVNTEWLAALGRLEPGDWRWFWCFYEKDAPIALLRSTRPGSTLIELGASTLAGALQTYRDNMKAFGTAWRFVDPMPDPEITLADLPKWMGAE